MVNIRYAQNEDLDQVNEINNYYILNSFATFDTHAQTIAQRGKWFQNFKIIGPHRILVAEANDQILGYACSSKFRDHFAFDQTVETSIYVAHNCKGKRIGYQLYEKLFFELRDENLHVAVVGIALPNEASISLHKKFDFEEVGAFKEYALKNNKFISSLWMQKRLNK